MRLYSFVAGLYLNELQKGLQTAHAVARLGKESRVAQNPYHYVAFREWEDTHDTIIILNAYNHKGVMDVFAQLKELASKLHLPATIFHEDEQSMNGMATCAAIVVPEMYYVAQEVPIGSDALLNGMFGAGLGRLNLKPDYIYSAFDDETEQMIERMRFKAGSPEHQLISLLKSYKLA